MIRSHQGFSDMERGRGTSQDWTDLDLVYNK